MSDQFRNACGDDLTMARIYAMDSFLCKLFKSIDKCPFIGVFRSPDTYRSISGEKDLLLWAINTY